MNCVSISIKLILEELTAVSIMWMEFHVLRGVLLIIENMANLLIKEDYSGTSFYPPLINTILIQGRAYPFRELRNPEKFESQYMLQNLFHS